MTHYIIQIKTVVQRRLVWASVRPFGDLDNLYTFKTKAEAQKQLDKHYPLLCNTQKRIKKVD